MSPKQTWAWFVSRYEQQGYKSLNQFAIANGFQKSSLSRYFHRQREIPANTLVALCKALRVSPGILLTALGYKVK